VFSEILSGLLGIPLELHVDSVYAGTEPTIRRHGDYFRVRYRCRSGNRSIA
jgi:hypothetical protein